MTCCDKSDKSAIETGEAGGGTTGELRAEPLSLPIDSTSARMASSGVSSVSKVAATATRHAPVREEAVIPSGPT